MKFFQLHLSDVYAATVCSMVIAATCTASPAVAQEQVVTLAESKLYVAPDNKVQKFDESISLSKGQDKLQLTLTYYNGTATAPGFKWLRVNSSSMSYLTEQQFAGKKYLSLDVTGDLSWGGNQILIEAGGPKGATFGWRLTTPAPAIQSVTPTDVDPGETITVTGRNFCSDPTADVATINGAPATCVSATSKSVVLKVPENVQSGPATLKLSVAGLDAGSAQLGVTAGAPVLTGLSSSYVPPGSPLTIYGRGLSPEAGRVRVAIGPFPADITAAATNSVTVTAPYGFTGNPWGINQPIKVWVNGTLARNKLTVSIYNPTGNQ